MNRVQTTSSFDIKLNQQGATVIFCLVFLAMMTIMGIAGMESSIIEDRMSGNMVDRNRAFQAAESALRNGEAWLDDQVQLPLTSPDGSTGVWQEDVMDPDTDDGKYWWEHNSISAGWWSSKGLVANGMSDVAVQPRYVIEEFHSASSGQSIALGNGQFTAPRTVHRVTAFGVGASETSEVKLQSTFIKPYDL